MTDYLKRETILAALDTQRVGRHLEVHDRIDSTNDRAAALARQGAPEGTVVLADTQTAGKGRLGRRWHAPPGSSLLLSVLLRPEIEPSQAQRMTMICSLAAVEAISATSGVEAGIKWPNDLVVSGRKLGGILTELGLEGRQLAHTIVGLGINVNLNLDDLPDVMAPPASLLAETGRLTSRTTLLVELLRGIEERYDRIHEGWSPHDAWRAHLTTLGERVQVGTPGDVIVGKAIDVDADGALMVRTDSGAIRRILAGDVTLRGG
jgi:BirA family biotin operon repressor/biotin-[acetyl-CoA-carboxylase] ligase